MEYSFARMRPDQDMIWLILIPILFIYYAHKIQQFRAAVNDFSKGLMRTKILALDSATVKDTPKIGVEISLPGMQPLIWNQFRGCKRIGL